MAGKMTIYKLVVLGDGGVGKVNHIPLPFSFHPKCVRRRQLTYFVFYLFFVIRANWLDCFDNSGT